jgi:hypothetical protein
MSQSPVLYLPIDEETQLRLHEEWYAEEYFALIERNRAYLREWMPWAAYEGSLEETKALCWLLETSVPKKSANGGSTGSFSLQFMHQ